MPSCRQPGSRPTTSPGRTSRNTLHHARLPAVCCVEGVPGTQLGVPSRRALVGRVCEVTEVMSLQHSDHGTTTCMAMRRRAVGRGLGRRSRESQPAPR
ncbi:hypothetical protein PAHAL_5G292300 [Panicum hallii]|uniref:Uncharacterized protein n=1 Tax=Panicum hallii TaxID=206008 RepID=A0A2T8ILS4_9POAL|nr:hypothetical protein PAHAL_5G292300 [Panicum hallii]PVH38576.1 hypothetical protein PAHAL_5G292300 [Panicum hallii]